MALAHVPEDQLEVVQGIGALLAARPVISLGYGPKHRALLADIGAAEHAHDIDDIDVPLVLEQVANARRSREATALDLHRVRQQRGAAVQEHLADLVGGWSDLGSPALRSGVRT